MVNFRTASLAALFALATLGFGQSGSGDVEYRKRVIDAIQIAKLGNESLAIQRFETLNTERPHQGDVLAWLGFLYLKGDMPKRAVPVLVDAAEQRPNDFEVMTNLATAYYKVGDYDNALARYAAILKAKPDAFEPHYNSGNIDLARQDYRQAITEYQAAAKLKPDDAFVRNNLGVAYEGLKDHENAAMAFQKAADLAPSNVTFARNAGLTLAKTNRRQEAIPYLQRAEGDPSVKLALADIYSKADAKTPEAQKENTAKALALYESVKTEPNLKPSFWYNLGVLRAKSGDDRGAEQAYRRAVAANPADYDSNYNLGIVLYRQGKYAEAMTAFDKAAGLDPGTSGSINAKLYYAQAATKTGNSARAIAAWKDVLRYDLSHSQQIRSTNTEVRLSLANAFYDAGRYQEASTEYYRILKVEKNNPQALNGVGLLHLRASRLPQAEAAFRSSIAAQKDFVPAYNNLAITLERMNRKAQALAVLERARGIDPKNSDVLSNIRRIKAEG